MSKTIIKKKIELGKISYWGKQRRNMVDVEIEIRECGGYGVPEFLEFSVVGNIWNNLHTDIVCGGQCLDTIAEYVKTPLMEQIHSMWKRWHLNGLHAGTYAQEEAVKRFRLKNGGKYDYPGECEYLKSIGLYEVEFTGKTTGRMYDHEPYKYGTAWIVEDLPEYVVKWVQNLEV